MSGICRVCAAGPFGSGVTVTEYGGCNGDTGELVFVVSIVVVVLRLEQGDGYPDLVSRKMGISGYPGQGETGLAIVD